MNTASTSLLVALLTSSSSLAASPFVQVDGGYLHTCARRADGTVLCWGQDDQEAVSGAPKGTFVEVSAGLYRSCARPSSGPLVCWGKPVWPTIDPALMLDIDEDEGEQTLPSDLASLTVGDAVDCGLDTKGRARCWGPTGPLTRGVPEGELDLTAIALGYNHACVRREDGSLFCWGAGSKEDGGAPFQAVPPRWPVREVAVGLGYHTCGLRNDGSVSCWGSDGSGDGGTVYAGTTRAPPGTFVAISAGHDHSCALRADGTVTCWGEVEDPPAEWTFTQISSGAFHACGVTTDGGVRCWGGDQFGQVKGTPTKD